MYITLKKIEPFCETINIKNIILWEKRATLYIPVIIDVETSFAFPIDDSIIINSYGEIVEYTEDRILDDTLERWAKWTQQRGEGLRLVYIDDVLHASTL